MAGRSALKTRRVNAESTASPPEQASTKVETGISKNSRAKGPSNPNRFTKFHEFKKIPPEIRLKIWRYTMRPRIIRAEYQNITSELVHEDVRLARYVLDAGVVPVALHVNSESRYEAKRFYSLVKAKLPVRSLKRDGERPLPGAEPPKLPAWLDAQIWINPNTDIFFFVNFPTTPEFLTYFRRISRPSIGGIPFDKPIKHIALVGKDTQRFRTAGRTELFYHLCMEHSQLQTINIVLDNSKFREDLKPESYALWKVNPLPIWSERGGGQHGARDVREHCIDIFTNFWEGKKTVKEVKRWVAWREMNRDWKPPKVMLKRIAKIRRPPTAVRKTRAAVVEVEDNVDAEFESEAEGEDGKQASQTAV